MTEDLNMSIRTFLKRVGVSSQAEIERAVRAAGDAGGQTYSVKMVLTSPDLDLDHEVVGTISATGADPD
ncbi:MAG: DUF6494 family protein [Pseudomonadota bacterium]